MKKFFAAILCFCGTSSFAQNGFFLQPEIGAGISNTSWKPSSSTTGDLGQNSVFSYQGQLDIGYRAGKWQFITGLGYLQTGVNLKHAWADYFNNYPIVFLTNNFETNNLLMPSSTGITDYNPHYVIPVKIGYEVCRFNSKLSFNPIIGIELAKNLPRTFVYSYNTTREPEQKEAFNYNCSNNAIMGLAQLNFEYRLNNSYDLTFGPSVHYMFTSELNFKDEHDYSVLMNLGLKWNFKKRTQNVWANK